MKKNGFTLMELMVYIAIVGIVVMVAGQAFSDSTKFRVRTQNMLKASEMVVIATELLKEDVSQMGAKSHYVETTGTFAVDADVLMPVVAGATEEDKSSFNLTQKTVDGKRADELTLRRIRYDATGGKVAVEEIEWFVSNGNLIRRCKNISGTATDVCPKEESFSVIVAENVEQFKIVPGIPAEVIANVNTRLFPGETAEDFGLISRFAESENFNARNADGSTSEKTLEYSRVVIAGDESFQGVLSTCVTIYAFKTNYHTDDETDVDESKVAAAQLYATNEASKTNWKECTSINFKANQEYAIRFVLGYSDVSRGIFVPGRDHATVGLRSNEGAKISGVSDFFVYPPADGNGSLVRQDLRFVPKSDVSACVAFTFANYSPKGRNLQISIRNLEIYKVISSNYTFTDATSLPHSLSVKEKAPVRALQVEFDINKNREVDKTSIVVPVPSNGDKEAL